MKTFFLYAAVLCLVVSLVAGAVQYRQKSYDKEAQRFERILHKKTALLSSILEELKSEMGGAAPLDAILERSPAYQRMAREEGIYLFYFERGRLRYWSDHSVAVGQEWNRRLDKAFLSLRNADYVSVQEQVSRGRLLGMVEIRKHYPFENQYLVNTYQHDFDLDPLVQIDFLEDEGTYPVFTADEVYLFSLDFSELELMPGRGSVLVRLGLILFLVFSFMALFQGIPTAQGIQRKRWLAGLALLLVASALLFIKLALPLLFENSPMFSPELFASRVFPSLGHLGVITMTGLSLVYLYVQFVSPPRAPSLIRRLFSFLLLAVVLVLFLSTELLIRSLVRDSGISFEANRITTFSAYTLVGLLIILSWIVASGMVLNRVYVHLGSRWKHWVLYVALPMLLLLLLSLVLPGKMGHWSGWILLLAMSASLFFVRQGRAERIPFSRFFLLIMLASAFMVIRLQYYSSLKVDQQREVAMVKLGSEHDPVAEMLFSELSMAIRNDSILGTFMDHRYIDIDPLVSHLRRNYFSGYWSKYDMLVTVCRPDDQVFLQAPEERHFDCYDFFQEMISVEGIAIPSSDFYYLENLNGRISYLAAIPYFQGEEEHRVFIELDSKIRSEELGYPELLLDERYAAFTNRDFSTARYHQGVLITQKGDFPYRRSSSFYTSGKESFEQLSYMGYEHSIYNMDEENTIIVGSPSVKLVDYLISFSYLFAINFLVVALLYLSFSPRIRRHGFQWNFKNRIQYSMVGVLFLTFAMISSGTIYFVVTQNRDKNSDNLRNTMRSVYIELVHKVEYEDDLENWSSESYFNLDELLQKFSNVFYTDINLYDEEGALLASSRQELFDQQLLSRHMNRQVYEELSEGRASEYIHNECIGELKYISAYVPLLNSENQFLAYLNLPYFTQSEALTRDVTNVVVAIVNIYLILLLLILGASVFLADRITQPLRVIQNRIGRVSFGGKNEKINYERSDEIRGLVEEYNFMVEELERSAGLLAQSERESAWREMAKQIAHEIKNPLTPMKLNVQHLQRTLTEGEHDPSRADRIASTLIEQIDSLSAIANEFSDFAKMPKAKSSRVNLVRNLENLQQLYGSGERGQVRLDLQGRKKVYVFADKEQLTRVFINLVRNGLQSVPESRKACIDIRMEVGQEQVEVAVKDNGKGIPEEIRDKLFRPNFTTKSGGMGMGLAISYNIVRSMGGEISYETNQGQGTTFYVSLPLMVEK